MELPKVTDLPRMAKVRQLLPRDQLDDVEGGEELVGAFREFKSIWDPEWQMNPGKVVNPHRTDEDLRLGATYEPPQPKTHFQFPEDNGCCGMAGSFGFEAGEHYDVAVKAGERVLLPAVRDAANDTLIIADGFSCRTQIEQGTDRQALHVAQVIQMALHEGSQGPAGNVLERAYLTTSYPRSPLKLAALAGGALFWGLRGSQRR